jgi:hypothetical protein
VLQIKLPVMSVIMVNVIMLSVAETLIMHHKIKKNNKILLRLLNPVVSLLKILTLTLMPPQNTKHQCRSQNFNKSGYRIKKTQQDFDIFLLSFMLYEV